MSSGVFRDLVVTGRKRSTLFSVRAPGALLVFLPMLAVALGLAIDAGLLLGLVLSGAPLAMPADLPRLLTIGASIAALGWTGLAPLVAMFQAAVGLYVRWDVWKHRNDAPPTTPVVVVAPIEKEPDEYNAEQEAWRVALDRFFRAGEAAGGFSAGKLSGVAGSDSWPRLVHFYAGEAGGNVLRDAGGNVGHTWGHGWTLDRVMLAIGTNRLPHPDMPLPVIALFVASTTQRRAPQKSKSQARVIENAVKAGD